MVGMNTDFQTTAEALRLDAVRLEIAATELAHSALAHTTVSDLRHHYTHTLGETPTTTRRRINRVHTVYGRGETKQRIRTHYTSGRIHHDYLDAAIDKAHHIHPRARVTPLDFILSMVETYIDNPTDFSTYRAHLDEQLNAINAQVGTKPNHHKRALRFSAQDHQGGVRLSGYLPAHQAAIVTTTLNNHTAPTGKDDHRTHAQRLADALAHVCGSASGGQASASLVVSVTSEQLSTPDAQRRYPTNTGITLTAKEVMELIDPEHAFLAIHHPVTFEVLALGRTKRLASAFQRMALWLEHPVCMYPGCHVPAHQCQAHHIIRWEHGGDTNLDNLALLCPTHHARVTHNNNVARAPNKVWVSQGQPQPNNHPAARRE